MTGPNNPYLAVLDTCVLAPMPLCDTLLRLAEDPAFNIPKWSEEIHRELRRTLGRMGYSQEQCERRRAAMEMAFPDAAVEGYEGLVESMTNDRKDRHVLAAAVRCGAHCIVTQNRRHWRVGSRWTGCWTDWRGRRRAWLRSCGEELGRRRRSTVRELTHSLGSGYHRNSLRPDSLPAPSHAGNDLVTVTAAWR